MKSGVRERQGGGRIKGEGERGKEERGREGDREGGGETERGGGGERREGERDSVVEK